MIYEESSSYCSICEKKVRVKRRTINNTFHLLATALTMGIWFIIWAIIWLGIEKNPWFCTHCGQEIGKEK